MIVPSKDSCGLVEDCLRKVLQDDSEYRLCNRQVLFATRRAMGVKWKKRVSRREAEKRARELEEEEEDGDDGSAGSAESDAPPLRSSDDEEEHCDPAQEAKAAWHRDALPSANAEGEVEKPAEGEDRWALLSQEER